MDIMKKKDIVFYIHMDAVGFFFARCEIRFWQVSQLNRLIILSTLSGTAIDRTDIGSSVKVFLFCFPPPTK